MKFVVTGMPGERRCRMSRSITKFSRMVASANRL